MSDLGENTPAKAATQIPSPQANLRNAEQQQIACYLRAGYTVLVRYPLGTNTHLQPKLLPGRPMDPRREMDRARPVLCGWLRNLRRTMAKQTGVFPTPLLAPFWLACRPERPVCLCQDQPIRQPIATACPAAPHPFAPFAQARP